MKTSLASLRLESSPDYANLPKASFDAFVSSLKDETPAVRIEAIRWLGQINSDETTETLSRRCREPSLSPQERSAIIRALASSNRERSMEALVECDRLLQSTGASDASRIEIIEALAQCADLVAKFLDLALKPAAVRALVALAHANIIERIAGEAVPRAEKSC